MSIFRIPRFVRALRSLPRTPKCSRHVRGNAGAGGIGSALAMVCDPDSPERLWRWSVVGLGVKRNEACVRKRSPAWSKRGAHLEAELRTDWQSAGSPLSDMTLSPPPPFTQSLSLSSSFVPPPLPSPRYTLTHRVSVCVRGRQRAY